MEADDRRGMERLGFTSLPAPADNTTLALPPFGKQPGFKPGLIEHRRAVSPIRTDKLSSASPSDRLSGWRLAEGAADAAYQAAYRLRPKVPSALFGKPPTRYLLIAGGKGGLRQMAENRTVLFLHFYFFS